MLRATEAGHHGKGLIMPREVGAVGQVPQQELSVVWEGCSPCWTVGARAVGAA